MSRWSTLRRVTLVAAALTCVALAVAIVAAAVITASDAPTAGASSAGAPAGWVQTQSTSLSVAQGSVLLWAGALVNLAWPCGTRARGIALALGVTGLAICFVAGVSDSVVVHLVTPLLAFVCVGWGTAWGGKRARARHAEP